MVDRPFGLILPKKKAEAAGASQKEAVKRKRVFDEEESEEEPDAKAPPKSQHRVSTTKQTLYETMQKEALAQDATVFDYDDVYNDMKDKVATHHSSTKADKQRTSKYIVGMLSSAQERARNELRIQERKIQREREAEADTYGESLEFVTSAYKAHQEEVKVLEEQERLQAEKDDVTKKTDEMTGFYRSLLEKRSRPAMTELGPLQRESTSTISKTITEAPSEKKEAAPSSYDEEARRPQRALQAGAEADQAAALAYQAKIKAERDAQHAGADAGVTEKRKAALLTQYQEVEKVAQQSKEEKESAVAERFKRQTREEEVALMKQRALERRQKQKAQAL